MNGESEVTSQVATAPPENTINLATTTPPESISSRPTQFDQAINEPGIMAAGRGMSVDSMNNVAAGQVPSSENKILTASGNASNATLEQQAAETLPVTVQQNVQELGQSLLDKIDQKGQEVTPEVVMETLVEEEQKTKGVTKEVAQKQVSEFWKKWGPRVAAMGDYIGKLKLLDNRMGDLFDALFVGREGRFGGDEASWGGEKDDPAKHLSLSDFKEKMGKTEDFANQILLACESGEESLFRNGFGQTSGEQETIRQNLRSKNPEKILEVVNQLSAFLFDSDDTQIRAKAWSLVSRQLGVYMSGEQKKTLGPTVGKFLEENYKDPDHKAVREAVFKNTSVTSKPAETASAQPIAQTAPVVA